MSNPIEFAARKAVAALTGIVNPAEERRQQDARGAELIRNMATGGLALGTGTGALVALVNYLKSMKEEDAALDESRLNDDTLYIPSVKSAADESGVNRWLAPGLAATGGILSAAGAYALTQSVYNYLQKKRRQELLDAAQGEALLEADKEIAKSGSARMDFGELVTAFPVAVPLLAALASGGVAYAALKKTFPTVKNPKSKYPKRIRIVAGDGTVENLSDEAEDDLSAVKLASARVGEADLADAAIEFLMLTVDEVSREKSAKHRLTSDVLHRVAKDGLADVVKMQKEGGMTALIESVRGASDIPADLPNVALAAAAICKSARLSPVMSMIASAEFQELAPDLYETALSYGEEQMDKFAGLAPLLQLAYFRPLILEKSAMSNPLRTELMQQPGLDPEEPLVDIEALTSDVNGAGAVETESDADLLDEEEVSDNKEEDFVYTFFDEKSEASPILDPVGEETEEEILSRGV